jgi:hypothetical protein
MKKMDLTNVFSSEEQRKKERVAAIYIGVSPADWSKIPGMCQAFFRDMETSLAVFPVVSVDVTSFEVWFSLLEDFVDVKDAEAYIAGYFSGCEY